MNDKGIRHGNANLKYISKLASGTRKSIWNGKRIEKNRNIALKMKQQVRKLAQTFPKIKISERNINWLHNRLDSLPSNFKQLSTSRAIAAVRKTAKKTITIIKNATSEEQLNTIKAKLNDPKSPLNKLTFKDKGKIEELIIDKRVEINNIKGTDQLEVRQPSDLRLAAVSPKNTQKILTFIKKTKFTEQLDKLKKHLETPTNILANRLTFKETGNIIRLILDRKLELSNINR